MSLPGSSSSSSSPFKNKTRSSADIGDEEKEIPNPSQKPFDPKALTTPDVSESEEPNIPAVTANAQAIAPVHARPQEIEDVGPPIHVDRSSFDLGAALRNLRSDNNNLIVQTLRKLHLRFWHASEEKLTTIIRGAGVDKKVLDLIPSVCNSCKVCRMWHRPANRATTSTRVSTKFNQVVQIDLLFVEDMIIIHLIDEATRFSICELIPNKQTTTIIDAVTLCWFKYFGPPE